jgi:RimJ/RimL family protein N-acetyltransferase
MAECDEGNIASITVLRGSGFSKERVQGRRAYFFRNHI